jgi:Ca2+-binding EF-hand superfamily protein
MKNSGFNIASDEIEKIIDNCSYIHNGKINFTEFLVATMNKKALMNEELMWEAFTYFDKKNEGKILGKDLKTALERAGCEFKDGEFEEIIREAQLEMNADIDYENFKVFMSCFEEESEVLNSNLAHITLVKRMTTDFRVQMLKAGTLGKTIEVSR